MAPHQFFRLFALILSTTLAGSPSVALAQSQTPHCAGASLVAETVAKGAAQWAMRGADGASFDAAPDGQSLHLRQKAPESVNILTYKPAVLRQGELCLDVVVPNLTDETLSTVGVNFWADAANTHGYNVTIGFSGYSGVTRYDNYTYKDVSPWTKTAAVKTRPGDINRLRLQLDNRHGIFIVNDVVVAEFRHEDIAGVDARSLWDSTGFGRFEIMAHGRSGQNIDWSFPAISLRTGEGEQKTSPPPPTPSPVAAAPQPIVPAEANCRGDVVAADDFSGAHSNWRPSSEALTVSGGVLRMAVAPGGVVTAFRDDTTLKQGGVCIDLAMPAIVAPQDAWAGVGVWVSADMLDVYLVLLDAVGRFGVQHFKDGKLTPIVPWSPQPVARARPGDVNRLQVVLQSRQATVWLNGQRRSVFQGNVDANAGGLALIARAEAAAPATWEFSNLRFTLMRTGK